MSAQTATMTPDQAYQLLHQRVDAPVFFNKLAAHGIRPRTDEEAQRMLELGYKLHAAHTAQQQKTAGARDVLSAIETAVDQQLTQQGLLQPNQEIFKVAAEAAQDNELAQAVLTLLQGQANAQAA